VNKQNMDWFMEAIKPRYIKETFEDISSDTFKILATKEQGSYIVRLQRQLQALDAENKIKGDQVATLTERCEVLTERLAKTNEALGKALAKAAVQYGHLKAKE